MTSVSPKNVSILLVACIPIVGFACSSKNGVEDTANPSNPIYNVTTGGGSGVSGVGGGAPIVWPPSGFTNVTNVQYGAYALGPQVGNDQATTGSATISNDGTTCSGMSIPDRSSLGSSITICAVAALVVPG